MPKIRIEGVDKPVNVDDSFLSLSPEDQARTVEEIASTLRPKEPSQYEGANAGIANFGKFAGRMASNVPTSAAHLAASVVEPFTDPAGTAENIYNVGKGVLQKFGIVSGQDSEKYADAVGKFFVDRYGSMDNIAKTLETDPVGALADLSAVLSLGGSAASRAPGVVGKVGEIASEAGRTIDPLTVAGKTVAGTANTVAAPILGMTTGAGTEAVRTAARSGADGGEAAAAFREGMSGANTASVVNEAKSAVAQLRQERGTAYKEAMANLSREDSALGIENRVLDFNRIDEAVDKVATVKKFKGQDLSPTTKDIRSEIVKEIDKWKALPPGDFHTVEGMDALKQKIGDIVYGSTQPGTPARVIGEQIYHGIRDTIVKQAPEYAKIMGGYEKANGIIREIESTLSLKPNANIDTSLRKLQSVLRNNVNTNYGRRTELMDFLVRSGAPHLMEKLAGQALSSATPRGLASVGALGELGGAATSMALGHPGAAGALIGTAVASSPKIVGGVAHGLGMASRLPFRAAGNTLFQLGRQDRVLQ